MSTIIIVGHGRSPEGRGWASRIDGCDTVIRMWDWHWQTPADYGAKYDIGFYEIDTSLLRSFHTHNRRTPARGWVASLLNHSDEMLPEPTEVICQKPWAFEARRMGGLGKSGRLEFTRGTIATLWALTNAAKGDTVILLGFDSIRAGRQLPIDQAFSPAYRANPGSIPFKGYVDNAEQYGNHDFRIELPMMQRVAARREVQLTFAEDLWREVRGERTRIAVG
jgi:hypothetical protein